VLRERFEKVLDTFPPPPGRPRDRDALCSSSRTSTGATHIIHLSIEGYSVSADLIERVRAGNWGADRIWALPIGVLTYSGLNAASPLDQTARSDSGGQGFGSNPATAATASTSSANELVFALAGFPASFGGGTTAGSSFTMLAAGCWGLRGRPRKRKS
jgi:hypothetical protein